jgi:hypothetical protein
MSATPFVRRTAMTLGILNLDDMSTVTDERTCPTPARFPQRP